MNIRSQLIHEIWNQKFIMIDLRKIKVGDMIVGIRSRKVWLVIAKKPDYKIDIYSIAENRTTYLGLMDYRLFEYMEKDAIS